MNDFGSDQSGLSLRQLCRLAFEGDSDAFAGLFQILKEPCHRTYLKITSGTNTLEFADLYQEFQIYLHRNDRKVLCDAANTTNDDVHCQNFLVLVFQRKAKTWLKRRTKILSKETEFTTDFVNRDASEVTELDLADEVKCALEKLTALEAFVVVQVSFHGKTYNEIAQDDQVKRWLLDASANTIKGIVRTMRARLERLK